MKKLNLTKGLLISLLVLALCFTAFGAVKASAEETATETKTSPVTATYVAATDEITAGSNAYVYVVKAATGNKIKAGQAAKGQMENNKISLADLGIKSTKKDVFLYVCDKEVEVKDGETVAANLVIKGNAIKVVGVVDYTQADVPGSTDVISAYYKDKATKKNVDIESAKLVWSPDQETWYGANVEGTTGGRKNDSGVAISDGFNDADLAGMLEAGETIYLKQLGTDGGSGTAAFGSAVAKVKIAKQANAPKVKVDVAKDTIALKNGFDFAIATKPQNGTEYTEYTRWYTILPVLKTASVSDTIIGGTNTNEYYAPLDKKDSNAGKEVIKDEVKYYSYTKTAVKTLSIKTLFDTLGLDTEDDFRIAVRKSATNKKPASAVGLVELTYKAPAPLVYTESNVKGQFVVSTAEEFTKKGLAFSDIKAYPGKKADNSIATSGFDQTFAVVTNDVTEADEGSTFEYLVVAGKNYFAADGSNDAIDWTTAKWKKFDPAKLKITSKLAGQYSTVKGTKTKVTLGVENAAVADADKDGVVNDEDAYKTIKTLILVRRAGDKASVKRASEEIALYVVKSGKTWSLYSTVSNGEEAYKYTVNFAKYTSGAWAVDNTINPVSVWIEKNGNANVSFPTITKADFFKDGAADGLQPDTKKDAIAAGDDKGKYTLTVVDADVDETVLIREYANIKINVKTQVGTADATGDTVVSVIDGQINGTGDFYYVGTACAIPVATPEKPDGASDADPTYEYSVTGVTYANEKLTVTPASAENVEITITFKYTEAE